MKCINKNYVLTSKIKIFKLLDEKGEFNFNLGLFECAAPKVSVKKNSGPSTNVFEYP